MPEDMGGVLARRHAKDKRTPPGVARLPTTRSEAHLEGRGCIRCGGEDVPMRPIEGSSVLSNQLLEYVDGAGFDRGRATRD
jgi:hypothetical protein